MSIQRDGIRLLNDELRHDFAKGQMVMTCGIAALGEDAVARIVRAIKEYDNFDESNDPWNEHDFGAFEAEGQKIFFKIDYYDRALSMHSPDPADPTVTERVLTIMLADEY